MIHTIKAHHPEMFDTLVNEFEKSQTGENGLTRVFAIQTHYHSGSDGERDEYVAVIFYREARP